MKLRDQIDKNIDYTNWFRKEYYRLHKCCPSCGNPNSIQTLVGYTIIPGKEDEFKDLNEARCSCGHMHTVHDRVPSKD